MGNRQKVDQIKKYIVITAIVLVILSLILGICGGFWVHHLYQNISNLSDQLTQVTEKQHDLEQQLTLEKEQQQILTKKLAAQGGTNKTVYLTFDDGPSANTLPILKVLEKHDVPATWFVIGTTGKDAQAREQAIVNGGHTLASHGYSHIYKEIYQSTEMFLKDLNLAAELIMTNTGIKPTVYRFPGGSNNGIIKRNGTTKGIIAALQAEGYTYYDWNVSSGDASGKALTAEQIQNNILSGIKHTSGPFIVLMHDRDKNTSTYEALDATITQLKAEGYNFARLTPKVKQISFTK